MRFIKVVFLLLLAASPGCRDAGPTARGRGSSGAISPIPANALVGTWTWEKNSESDFFRTETRVLEFFADGGFRESVRSETAGPTPIMYSNAGTRQGTWFVHEHLLVLRDPKLEKGGIGIASIFEIKTITPDTVTMSNELIKPDEQVTWRRRAKQPLSRTLSRETDRVGSARQGASIEHGTSFSASISNAAQISFDAKP
jgi:hypothetical protein